MNKGVHQTKSKFWLCMVSAFVLKGRGFAVKHEMLYEGKSKVVYYGENDESVIIKYKDTATAFNGEKKVDIVGKGKLNAQISAIIFDYLAKNGIQTHLIKILDETSILAKKAEIIMVEVIVRNLAAGGFSEKYKIPEGSPLKNVVLEFCFKNDECGDPMMNESQITAIGLAGQEELDIIKNQALKINNILVDLFEKADIKLVDLKLEFGRSNESIILCDEISPDSCRLWDAKTNEKLDKDRFRRDLGKLIESYEEVYSRIKNALKV